MELDEIARLLKDRRVSYVARKTGLGKTTIQRIRDGKQKNPCYQTIQVLIKYLTESLKNG